VLAISPVTPALDNRELYGGRIFDDWSSRTALTKIETSLVERFLQPDLRTVEAGTGAGRILLSLHDRGFGDLYGFDYVPGLIEIARNRARPLSIAFSVQNATDLDYPDDHFDQAVYLQQVLCFIEDPSDRSRAMREAGRIVKPGGTALFSFLSYEGRMHRPLYSAFARFLRLQRRFRHRDVSLQYQPWLRTSGKPNLAALADSTPYVYWYKYREALDSLDRAGFRVTWVASSAQVGADESACDPQRLEASALEGMLYAVCRRR
jgi:SAM-dependent methyltransferase